MKKVENPWSEWQTLFDVFSIKITFLQIRSIDVEALERNLGNPGSSSMSDPSAESSNKFVITGWNLFAQAADRILFVIYVLIIFIFLGAYLGGATAIIDKFTK